MKVPACEDKRNVIIFRKKKNILIFAYSGLSNAGKITMQATSTLDFRRPYIYKAADAYEENGIDLIEDAVSEGFRVLTLDGCTDRCATKSSKKTS